MPHKYSNCFTYGIISSCHAHATFLFLCSHCGMMELKETRAHSPVNKMHFHWCVYSWTYTEVRIVSLNKCLWSCMHAVICMRCAGGGKNCSSSLFVWLNFFQIIHQKLTILTPHCELWKSFAWKAAGCLCWMWYTRESQLHCRSAAQSELPKTYPPPHPPSSSSSL